MRGLRTTEENNMKIEEAKKIVELNADLNEFMECVYASRGKYTQCFGLDLHHIRSWRLERHPELQKLIENYVREKQRELQND